MFSIVHLSQYVETLKTEKEVWIYKTLVISNRSNYLVKSWLDEQNFTISFRTQIGRHSNLRANSVLPLGFALNYCLDWTQWQTVNYKLNEMHTLQINVWVLWSMHQKHKKNLRGVPKSVYKTFP